MQIHQVGQRRLQFAQLVQRFRQPAQIVRVHHADGCERRTGERAALCDDEVAGESAYRIEDA